MLQVQRVTVRPVLSSRSIANATFRRHSSKLYSVARSIKLTSLEVRGPVAWIAGWGETKPLKPIDRHFLGECASHRAVTKVNVDVASKMKSSEGRARNREGEGSMGSGILTDTAIPLRRGGSDGTKTRTC